MKLLRDGGDLIEQGRQKRFGGRRLRGLERSQHPCCQYFGADRLQGRDQVSQKASGVAIPFVQRQPGDRPPAAGEPFADQRGFAKPGRGRDEGQLATVQALVQPLDQARARGRMFGRGGGIYSFVAKIGAGIDQL